MTSPFQILWQRNETVYELPKASLNGFHPALPIFDLERLDLHIGVLPENQLILTEQASWVYLGIDAPFIQQTQKPFVTFSESR